MPFQIISEGPLKGAFIDEGPGREKRVYWTDLVGEPAIRDWIRSHRQPPVRSPWAFVPAAWVCGWSMAWLIAIFWWI